MPTVLGGEFACNALSVHDNPGVTSENTRVTFCDTVCWISHLPFAASPPAALHLLLEVSGEADGSALAGWRVHELADRRENGGDGQVVLGEFFIQPRLELREAPGQFPVGAQQLTQVHEG